MKSDAITLIRKREQQDSCDILGTRLVEFGICMDGLLIDNEANRLTLAQIIRDNAPHVIVTHNEHDYHPDHCTCLPLVRAAIQLAFHIKESGKDAEDCITYNRSPQIILMDSVSGSQFSPHFFVDVTGNWVKKRDALIAHKSQIEMMAKEKIDLIELACSQTRWRGEQSGVEIAEAFRFYNDWAVTHAIGALPLAPIPIYGKAEEPLIKFDVKD